MLARIPSIYVLIYLVVWVIYLTDEPVMLKCNNFSSIKSDWFVIICISSVSTSQLMLVCYLFQNFIIECPFSIRIALR